jgi:hypothetical protein
MTWCVCIQVCKSPSGLERRRKGQEEGTHAQGPFFCMLISAVALGSAYAGVPGPHKC